ncbi:MAG: cupin domain-containing protein [Acidobacteria bacterium]|nr:MAG: cupin domain-containing protein [Acidobacteriota bacterium]
MISRRDVLIAAISCCVTFGIVALAQSNKTLMTSAVFDWEKIAVTETKTGATRDFFKGPTATLDQLECHVTTLKVGEAPHAAHSHPEEELMIVKEGTLESVQNGEVKRAGPGSIIFQASNQMHGVRNVGSTPATYFVIKWYSPGMLKKP